MPANPFDAAILAGGRSSRMGTDKALLRIGGRTLLERQVALASSLGPGEVFVSGRRPDELGALRARALPDASPGLGPLGGLTTVLDATRAPHVLVLAVDMPALTPDFLARLLAWRAPGVGAVPRTRAGWEPAAAVYPRELAPRARAALARGRGALHALVEEGVAAGELVAMETCEDELPLLVSWNTPADAAPGPCRC